LSNRDNRERFYNHGPEPLKISELVAIGGTVKTGQIVGSYELGRRMAAFFEDLLCLDT